MRLSIATSFLPVLLLPLLNGCFLTSSLWKEANETKIGEPVVAGVVKQPTKDVAGKSAIIFTYRVDTGSVLQWRAYVYMKVPADERFNPVPPFRYIGDERIEMTALQTVSDEQRTAVTQSKLKPAGWLGKTFVPADKRYPKGDNRYVRGVEGGGMSVSRVRYRPNGNLEFLPQGASPGSPDNAFFILVPATLDRPPEDARDAKVTAALLTPFTLAADVVVAPVVFVLFLLGGH